MANTANIKGRVLARPPGVTDAQLVAAGTALRTAGRAMSWLERARLCVMAGAADYERGYDNIAALVDCTITARERYDAALDGAGQLLGLPVDVWAREELATLLPDVIGQLLAPELPAAARPDVDTETPPENKIG